MTYLPSVLSLVDSNNSSSFTGTTFTGSSSSTNGYNTISLSIDADENSDASGLNLQFSEDGITFTTYYADTYFTGAKYLKEYTIVGKFYRIQYIASISGNVNITSRLSTDTNAKSNTPSYNNDSLYDAFSKLRVTNPLTLLDVKFPAQSTGTTEFLENNIIITNKSTTYTATYADSKCVITGTGSGSYINQSRRYCVYQPGKSLLLLASGIIYDGTGTGFKSRIGYFDEDNGLFFEYDSANEMGIVLRNNTVDTVTLQNNWNIDKMDGTGTSGFNLDFSKCQLFVIDLEWLGVGRVRYGFYVFGKIYYCHQIVNINTLNDVYMINPNLPIRYELTGTGTGTVTLTQICSSVISEGGYNPYGRSFSISNEITGITVSTTEFPILTIRGNSSFKHQNIIPSTINIFCTDNNKYFLYKVRLYLAPNSPGTITWTNVNNNSIVEYSTAISTFTTSNSIVVDSGYFVSKGSSSFTSFIDVFSNFIQITSNIDNVSDILVITAQATTGSGDVYASINWKEIY